MSSVFSRVVIEKYEDSFGMFIDNEEDLMGLSRKDVLSKINSWSLLK